MKWSLLAFAILGLAFTAGSKLKVLEGDQNILKESKSVYVELDFSNAKLDALDSEEAFVEYKKGKSKDPEQWEKDWKKDKNNFISYYTESMERACKKYPFTFNNDNPDSDYKLVVEMMDVQTGNPVKKSSVESKLHFYANGSEEKALSIYLPKSYGVQMSAMTPTVGMRVNVAMATSIRYFKSFYKKAMK